MNQENKKVILLVDDDENTRKMYAELFRQEEIEVLEAQDGIEGLMWPLPETILILFLRELLCREWMVFNL